MDLKEMNASLAKSLQGLADKDYPGFEYQDFPQMKKSYWEYILRGFGEEDKDYKKLSEATYEYKDGIYMRGQLLLSPDARNNLKEYRKNNSIPE